MYNKIKRIAALFLAAALMVPTAVFATGTEGGTQADPRQSQSDETATIYLGKVLSIAQPDKFPIIDDFAFTIQNIEAWDNSNLSTTENGTPIAASDMPRPAESSTSHHKIQRLSDGVSTRVYIGDFTGDANTAVEDTTLEKYRVTHVPITYSRAGYYLYKVTEDVANTEEIPGMAYDSSSYYIVVYVCNKTDAYGNTTPGVYVHDITSYRNDSESDINKPNLSDIHNIPDNNGVAAVPNTEVAYAKVGISADEKGKDPDSDLDIGPNKLEAYRFFNDQTTHDLVLTNNVTGNLGDIVKEFEYIVTLSGLEKNKVYTTNVAAQYKDADAAVGSKTSDTADILALTDDPTYAGKGTIDSSAKTFTSDADGKATFKVKLADDETIVFNALPASSKYQIRELSSDHIASFTSTSTQVVSSDDDGGWVMELPESANTHSDLVLDTANEIVDAISNVGEISRAEENDGTVTIMFKNHRDILTPTGLPYYGDFVYVIAGLAVAGLIIFAIRRRKQAKVSAE